MSFNINVLYCWITLYWITPIELIKKLCYKFQKWILTNPHQPCKIDCLNPTARLKSSELWCTWCCAHNIWTSIISLMLSKITLKIALHSYHDKLDESNSNRSQHRQRLSTKQVDCPKLYPNNENACKCKHMPNFQHFWRAIWKKTIILWF